MSAESINVDELRALCNPLRHLRTAIEVVGHLNDVSYEAGGTAFASFSGNDTYLCITWGDDVLWDTEGDCFADIPLTVDTEEPSYELCRQMILYRCRETEAIFEEATKC